MMKRTLTQRARYWAWRVCRVLLVAYTLVVVSFGLSVAKQHAGRAMEVYYPAKQIYQPAGMMIKK